MSIAIFALFVGLVAVVGGLFIEYQKTKANISLKSAASDQDVDNLLHEISSLKKRVQNLEAIVVANEDQEPPLLDREDIRDEILQENLEKVRQKAANQNREHQ
jgi:hypothetical protein